MQVRDKNFRWTEDATKISDKVRDVLHPIFEDCVRNGMTLEGFHYLVCTEVNEMMLLDLLDGDKLIRLRDG